MNHPGMRWHMLDRIARKLEALAIPDRVFLERQEKGMGKYGDASCLERSWDGKQEVMEELADAFNLTCMAIERGGTFGTALGLIARTWSILTDEGRPMLVYIAHPYSGDREDNVRAARRLAILVMQKGHIPVTPHLMFDNFDVCWKSDGTHVMNPIINYDVIIEAGLTLLQICDLMLCAAPSPGVCQEWLFARRIGKPVIYGIEELPCRDWDYRLQGTLAATDDEAQGGSECP